MMKKVIIADRLNPLVRNVFNNYTDFDGGVIALAAVCYTVQLYMDFSGSMDAVTGTAQILGGLERADEKLDRIADAIRTGGR